MKDLTFCLIKYQDPKHPNPNKKHKETCLNITLIILFLTLKKLVPLNKKILNKNSMFKKIFNKKYQLFLSIHKKFRKDPKVRIIKIL